MSQFLGVDFPLVQVEIPQSADPSVSNTLSVWVVIWDKFVWYPRR
jgi:hypothetical protein